MHKPSLSTLPRVLLAPLNFIFSLHDLVLCDFYSHPRISILIRVCFNFTSFDLIIEHVVNITYMFLFSSHGLLLGLLIIRLFSCTYTHLLLFVDWDRFNCFIIWYPHSTKCTSIPMTYNNFYHFIYLFACLFS